MMIVERVTTIKNLKELRQKVDKNEWLMGPADVNAYYMPPFNTICMKKII